MLFLAIANTSTVSCAQETETGVETSHTSEIINDNTNDDISNESFNHCFSSGNTVRLMLDSDYYPAETEIDLVIHTSLSAEIENMEFTAEGFSLTNDFQTVGNEIHFSVLHISEYENSHLMINFDLTDAPDMYVQLFGVAREDMLFVNQYGYLFAEQAYEYHFGSNDEMMITTTKEIDNNVLQIDYNSVQATYYATPDTTIKGSLFLKETSTDPYPIRFCKISFYEYNLNSPNSKAHLGDTYTDQNGQYSFSFVNNTDDSDGSGSDILMIVSLESYDATVRAPLDSYEKVISDSNTELVNMSAGTHNFDYYFYVGNEADFFELGMRILQMVTYAAYYYEEMKGEDVTNATVIFPSSTGPAYSAALNTIFIPGKENTENVTHIDFCESWDVVLHEYGHHILNKEGWSDSPGGGHQSDVDMAEHYKYHFQNNTLSCDIGCSLSLDSILDGVFLEKKCKYKGMALAWSEGCATFFSIASQLYCQEIWFEPASNGSYTHGIRTFGNATIDYDNRHQPISYLSSSEPTVDGQNTEIFVPSILFSTYYHPTDDQPDNLNLGHRAMWEIMKAKDAKTIYEFVDYFVSHYPKEYVSKLGKILHINYHATSAPIIRERNGVIEFHFDWEDLNSNGYYKARKFQVNFYDEQYNLITSTEPDTSPSKYLYVSSNVWSSLINNRNSVYVSITTYEYDGNIGNTESDGYYITHYESELTQFINPSIATSIYYNTQASVVLNSGGVAWYKFTAPDTTTYTFSITGGESAYWELFGFTVPRDSKRNLLASSNQFNSHTYISNSAITYNLEAGETVYIRVCGVNYESLNNTVLKVEHQCTYRNLYAQYSATQHKATCFCGNSRYESHSFITLLSKIKCENCGYITSGPGAIVKPFSIAYIDKSENVCYNTEKNRKGE